MDAARRDEVPRPQLAEAGLFLLLVAAPLVVTPFTSSPFADGKLVLVVVGTLLLVLSGVPIDRNIGLAAAALSVTAAGAAVAGVDPIVGLTAQTQSTGGGVILAVVIGTLAATGAALPEVLRDRARLFLIGAGIAVAVVAVAFRVAPDLYDPVFPARALRGSTLGNPVFGAAFCAIALAAVLGHTGWTWRRRIAVAAVLAFACATFEQRSALVLPIVAAATALWCLRPERRWWLGALGAVVGAILVFELVQPLLPPLGSTGLGQLQQVASDRARFTVWNASFEGWLERPALGWGPASTQTAYVRGATEAQLDFAGRRWGDAHNLALETLVTTGIPGVVALAALGWMLVRRAWTGRRVHAWAFAAALTLAIFSLGEPLNVVITPLLFLVAGIASIRGAAARDVGVGARRAVAGLLIVASVVTAVMFASATLERWGRTYGEIWALEASLDLQPWRISAQRELALRLSADASAGDAGAEQRAREVIDRAITSHPWNPDVRLWAAQVEHLMRSDDAALAWVEDHVTRFPADGDILESVKRNLEDPGFSFDPEVGAPGATQP